MKSYWSWIGIGAAVIAALTALMTLAVGLGKPPLAARAQAPRPADDGPTLPPPHLGYGINVRLESNIDALFAPLDLGWIKLWEEYEGTPPSERLPYQVLFVIDLREGMPADLDAWGDQIEGIARAGRGRVEAYEIGNEPNVERFWGGQAPNPAEYVQVLRVACERIKAVNPAAIIVSAGLAPVGRIQGHCDGWDGNNCLAMDEREYARQMLLLGAADYFDAFGYHPYGFAYEPNEDPYAVPNGFAFRGAEVMYDLLDQHDLGHKPLWATEFNWLRDWTEDGVVMPDGCRSDYERVFGWMEVSEVEQATYITQAFQYADEHWPWMGVMFVWNLDWHNYHVWDCEAAHHFSIRKDDGTVTGTSTLAYEALAAMNKRSGHFGPRLTVDPPAFVFEANLYQPGILTATLIPRNAGYQVLTWTAAAATDKQVTPTLAITTGVQGTPLTVTVDSTGHSVGLFTVAVTVTATTTDVLDSPQTVPITLNVVGARLAIEPPSIEFLTALNEPGILTATVLPTNTGYGVLTWTARVASGFRFVGTGTLGEQVTPTLAITTGVQGTPLTVTVDSTGYSTGLFVGAITVTATTTDVQGSPRHLPIIMHVVPEIRRVYLPLTIRSGP